MEKEKQERRNLANDLDKECFLDQRELRFNLQERKNNLDRQELELERAVVKANEEKGRNEKAAWEKEAAVQKRRVEAAIRE